MTAIRFPNSVGIGSGGGRTDSHHETRGVRGLIKSHKSSDVIEISTEAKNRFAKDNLIRLEKVKLMKEAKDYRIELNEELKFKEADLRNVYRMIKISDAKSKLKEGFFDLYEDYIIKKIINKPEI